jgi:glycosyltransferase involved in cell wall biosynthesis
VEQTREGRALVVVPAWNEADALPGVLRELVSTLPDLDVLVVDDGSTDGTADLVRQGGSASVVSLPFNIGVGGAMRAGFLYAERHGYHAVIQCDADGQHDPADVPKLLALLDGGLDIAIGARFAGIGDYHVGGFRMVAMKFLASSLSRMTGTKLTDVTSGFRASSARAVELFAREYPPEYLGDTIESLVLAQRAGLRIGQLPVRLRERQGGHPSQSSLRSVLYLGRAVLVLGLALLHRRDDKDDA